MKGLEATLREAIENSGMSLRELSRLSGVDVSQLSYFVNGKRSMTLTSAEKIVTVLGLKLKPIKKRG